MKPQFKIPSEQRWTPLGQVALLLTLSLLAWLPCLSMSEWSADDHEVILQNPVITGRTAPSEAFRRDYTLHVGESKQWRPLTSLTLRLDHALYGPESSAPWHASNVLLHLLTVALAWNLVRANKSGAWTLGLLFFSLHPILADSVAWVSGRPSMLCVALGLLGANLHALALRRSLPPPLVVLSACIAVGLPLLAKEDGVLFCILILGITTNANRSLRASSALGLLVAIAGWLYARSLALGEFNSFAAHPVLIAEGLPERLLVGLRASTEALRVALFPASFPPRYELGALPSLSASLLAISAYALVATLCCKRQGWSAWLFICPAVAFLPFMQLIPGGEIFAPRFAHIPLLFAIPLADKVLRAIPLQWSGLFLAALTLGTWRTIPHYQNLESYWSAAAEASPESPAAINSIGLVHQSRGEHRKALAMFDRSIAIAPGHSRSWSNKARSLYALGELDSATNALKQALQTGPKNPIAHVNWGRHLSRREEHSGAKQAFKRATELSPGLIHAWTGLADSCEALGELDECQQAKEQAERLSPSERSKP